MECGTEVIGDGYTNHCPQCLTGMHIDVNPGDRLSTCGGKMKPIKVEKEGVLYFVTHICEKCGAQRRNRLSPKDNYDMAAKVAQTHAIKVVMNDSNRSA